MVSELVDAVENVPMRSFYYNLMNFVLRTDRPLQNHTDCTIIFKIEEKHCKLEHVEKAKLSDSRPVMRTQPRKSIEFDSQRRRATTKATKQCSVILFFSCVLHRNLFT